MKFHLVLALLGLIWAAAAPIADAADSPAAAGDKLRDEGKLSEALAAYRKAWSAASGTTRAELVIRQALVLEMQGKLEGARELLQQARKDDAVGAAIEEARLAMEYPPFDPAPAVAALAEAVKRAPEHAGAQTAYGNALVNAGKPDEARDAFDRVTSKLDPKSVPARWGRSRMLLRQGKATDAIGALQEALELEPSRGETMVRLGNAYLSSAEPNRLAQARAWFEQAGRTSPGNPAYAQWEVLAYLLEDRAGDAAEKVAYLQEKFPDHSATLWAAGACAEVRTQMAQASDLYRKAAAVDARNLLAHYSLGQFASGRGNREWAKAGMTSGAYANYSDTDLAVRQLSYVLAAAGGDFPFAVLAQGTLDALRKRAQANPWTAMPAPVLTEFYNYGKALNDHY